MNNNEIGRRLTIVFLVSLATLGLTMLNFIYPNEQAAEHENYCELVLMWEEDAELGIEPTKRDGMPNYKGLECE